MLPQSLRRDACFDLLIHGRILLVARLHCNLQITEAIGLLASLRISMFVHILGSWEAASHQLFALQYLGCHIHCMLLIHAGHEFVLLHPFAC